MNSRDFCYWLQGYFEITGKTEISLTKEQQEMIQRHLGLVFLHELDEPDPDGALQKLHDATPDDDLVKVKLPKPKARPTLDTTLYRC